MKFLLSFLIPGPAPSQHTYGFTFATVGGDKLTQEVILAVAEQVRKERGASALSVLSVQRLDE